MSARTTPGGLAPRTSPQWGWVAASGVIGILIGVLALFFPGVTILAAAVFLGIGLVVQGIVEITAAIRGGTGATGRGWLVAFGVLALVAGVLVLFVPGTGVLVLVWGLILWFAVAGVNDLVAAASTREHRGWNIAMRIISLIRRWSCCSRPERPSECSPCSSRSASSCAAAPHSAWRWPCDAALAERAASSHLARVMWVLVGAP
ncbi:HdeD family acid-resistance protein [Actinomycetospora sp. CA-101289]|uniref:HdeD family acid-resistance protein n=1 Tax=Actinomycetospora sp. CA-101289 TaxID=3239893 RepID=UPI003D9897F3